MEALSQIPLKATEADVSYNEALLDEVLFSHPSVLPIREIDAAYCDPVPICKQLSTKVGPLDVLYVTREGRIVIAEAKLWRNPEARRKVIGQILDYASEMSCWTYNDLNREVLKRRTDSHTSLFSIVSAQFPDIDEAEFVDATTRSLREGRLLLLICGDGIREELSNIAEFLDRNTNLDLTFGLVELAIFATLEGKKLFVPRVLAKTVTLERRFYTSSDGRLESIDQTTLMDSQVPETEKHTSPYKAFWGELSNEIRFDDLEQQPFTNANAPNTSLRLPSPRAWITLYFAPSSATMGVFLTFNRGEPGDTFYSRLLDEQDQINFELENLLTWQSDGTKHSIGIRKAILDIQDADERSQAVEWFREMANMFVNAFRHRIGRYKKEI